MRIPGWLGGGLLLLAAAPAVALDPDEWSGTAVVEIRSVTRGNAGGVGRSKWINEDGPTLSASATEWFLTNPQTGDLHGDLRPLSRRAYRVRAEGQDLIDWASFVVSTRSFFPEDPGLDTVMVHEALLRGTITLNGDGSSARFVLRGPFDGIVSDGPRVGERVRGVIRVRLQGALP